MIILKQAKIKNSEKINRSFVYKNIETYAQTYQIILTHKKY